MLELLFNGNEQRFKKEFNQLILEVPGKVANIENSWIYLFLGDILTLPYVVGKKIRLKLDDNNTIKLLYQGEKEPITSVVITKNNIGFSIENNDPKEMANFIKIDKIPGLKLKREFLDIFAELNDSQLKGRRKQKTVEILFNQLYDIYNYYAENLNFKKNVEALYQAFIYGFFKMYFGNQVKCLLELSAGSGYADLVLMIGNTAVIVELKADNTPAKQAIEQIENRGYAHLSLLSKYKNIILVGTNLNTGEVSVESHDKFTSKGLVNLLMNEDEELEEEEKEEKLNEAIEKELAFLCHSKNIGICDPNDSLTYNKLIGSFAALLYGQVLQYCSYNENYTSKFQSINREGSSSITLTYEGNDVLFIQVTESDDKAGFQSSDCNEAGHYSTKIKITKGSESFIYKINKSNERVEVKLDEQNEHNDSLPRKSPRKPQKPSRYAQEEYVSSQESKKTASPCQHYDLGSLYEEIKNCQFKSLQEILEDNSKVFNSEGNLQLFLKGLLMNIPGLIVETEVGNTDKRADLVIKFSNGTAVMFELEFCENENEISSKLKAAKSQLKGYINGRIVQEVIDCENLIPVAVVFSQKGKKCLVSYKNQGEWCDLIDNKTLPPLYIDIGNYESGPEEVSPCDSGLGSSIHQYLLINKNIYLI